MSKNEIKKIREEFTTNGYKFKLIGRINDIAIFKGTKELESGDVNCYEVHKIRIVKSDYIDSPYKEKLASESEFGRYGWSFYTFEGAFKKFLNLLSSSLDSITIDTTIELNNKLSIDSYKETSSRI